MLVDHADAELVTLQQAVTVLPVGTQLDDTAWARSENQHLYVADTAANAIYSVDFEFQAATVDTEAPSDSGVASWVGTLDLQTGTATPVAIGFTSPSGLAFGPEPGNEGE